MPKFKKFTLECPTGTMPKCTKIRKKTRKPSKATILKTINKLDPIDQKRLEVLNVKLQKEKEKHIAQSRQLQKTKKQVKNVIKSDLKFDKLRKEKHSELERVIGNNDKIINSNKEQLLESQKELKVLRNPNIQVIVDQLEDLEKQKGVTKEKNALKKLRKLLEDPDKLESRKTTVLGNIEGYMRVIKDAEDSKRDAQKDLDEFKMDGEGKAGKGDTDYGGMYDHQIESAMDHIKNFQGVIAADEIPLLKIKPNMSFVMNTDPRSKPGEHWVCCYIDSSGPDKSINYYDPFGDQPSDLFMKDIKKVVDKLNPKHMLRFKVNEVKNQDVNSDNCGWHCINFLRKRADGESFKEATGFKQQDNSKEMEKEAEQIKKQEGFGYL